MFSRSDASSLESTTSTGHPSTFAAFSPVTLSSNSPSPFTRRSTILVHQKSPLLLATPPQITRALAYSHPFLLPLNELAGLLTWSTGDPWRSFLLLASFWALTLYGDVVVRRAGPVVVGLVIIAGMYGRRYSPLSRSGWREPAREVKESPLKPRAAGPALSSHTPAAKTSSTGDKKIKPQPTQSDVTDAKHQKTLDEIVDTLKEFTGRCNLLMEPLLEMTDFLSTQRTPTSATTRPALTAMFLRLLIVTPFWLALTAPPWRVLTTRRVILVAGTLALTWHSRAMRVSRTILWRSATVRRLAAVITGLRFQGPAKAASRDARQHPNKAQSGDDPDTSDVSARSDGLRTERLGHARSSSPGVKLTFIIYENQRRWIGLGWTTSLFAYERSAWTDEHNNAVPPKDNFELPDIEDGSDTQWQWADGSRWRIEGLPDSCASNGVDDEAGQNGWVYYDNTWQNGRRGQDGWGKWTRRRKWYRDAELVEAAEPRVAAKQDAAPTPTIGLMSALHPQDGASMSEKSDPSAGSGQSAPGSDRTVADDASAKNTDDSSSLLSTSSKSSFWPPSLRRRATDRSRSSTEKEHARRPSEVVSEPVEEEEASGLGLEVELEMQKQSQEGGQWGIGDEARMNLE